MLDSGELVFFLPRVQGGGLDRSVFSIAAGLRRRGRPVRLLLSTAERPTGGLLPDDVPVDVLGASRIRHMVPRLAAWLGQVRPARLHATAPVPLVSSVLAAKASRVGVTVSGGVHNLLEEELRLTSGWPRRSVVPALMRRAYLAADGLVALNSDLARHVEDDLGLEHGTVTVIPSPVMDRVRGEQLPAEDRHLEHGGPLLVTVGRLHRQKDLPTLLRAMVHVRDTSADVRLAVLGAGPDRSDLEHLASDLGLGDAVQFLGHRDDRLGWMRAADVYVQSSAYEGLGGTIIEALAVGAPVVATDAPHGPGLTLGGGRFGDLVPVGDVPALAEAIVARLANPWVPDLGDHLDQFELGPVVDAYERMFFSGAAVVS